MAIASIPAPAKAQSVSSDPDKRFATLQEEFLSIIHHLQLVDQRMYDFQEIPEEFQPAAAVLHNATAALDQLYNSIDGWFVHHNHSPKTEADRKAH
ncbi:MAG TPA: hypothetical protein VGT07_04600, partial [Steroidobacteraceae bacterium]|nr:hypothetical protein [Steroidobacteraceae bacterium]